MKYYSQIKDRLKKSFKSVKYVATVVEMKKKKNFMENFLPTLEASLALVLKSLHEMINRMLPKTCNCLSRNHLSMFALSTDL